MSIQEKLKNPKLTFNCKCGRCRICRPNLILKEEIIEPPVPEILKNYILCCNFLKLNHTDVEKEFVPFAEVYIDSCHLYGVPLKEIYDPITLKIQKKGFDKYFNRANPGFEKYI